MALSVRRNFAFKLSADLGVKVLGMVLTVGLARAFGPADWGGMQWALAWAGLAGAFADLGLSYMALREVSLAKAAAKHAWMAAAWLLKGLLWCIAITVLACLVWLSPWQGEQKSLVLAATVFTLGLSLGEFNGTLFSAVERLDLDLRTGLSSKFGQVLAAAVALLMGARPGTVLLAMAVAAWSGWAWGFRILWRHLPRGKGGAVWPRAAELLRSLWPFGFFPLLTMAYVRVDTLLLEHFRGLEAVGHYQAAYKWIDNLGFLPAAFAAATFPALARSGREGQGGLKKRLKALIALGALGGVAAAFLAGFATYLPAVYGQPYAPAVPLLAVLALSCLASFPNYALIGLLVAERRQDRLLLGALLGLLLNVGGNLWLMPRWGALGAAWMTVATEVLILGVYARALHDILPGMGWAGAALLWLCGGLLGSAAALAAGSWGLVAGPSVALVWALGWDLLPRAELQRLWKAR